LSPVFSDSSMRVASHHLSHSTEYMLMGISVAAIGAVIYYAYITFVKKEQLPSEEGEETSAIQKLIYSKYYVDELYATLFTKPLNWLSEQFYKFLELKFIDAIVNGVGKGVNGVASVLRLAQTGRVGFYIFAMVIGIVLMLFYKMM